MLPDIILDFPTHHLKDECAFESNPWPTFETVTREFVFGAIREGRLRHPLDNEGFDESSAIHHAERIAWFVENDWSDFPIDIDVGVPSMGYTPARVVCDGNHRLAAAFYRGDKIIKVEWQGEVEAMKVLIMGENYLLEV